MGFKDECGVIGIYGAANSASLTYFGLVSLQHRGQESAGIAVSDGEKISLKKEMGAKRRFLNALSIAATAMSLSSLKGIMESGLYSPSTLLSKRGTDFSHSHYISFF